MKKLFTKIKQWWNDKDYKGKNTFLSNMNIVLWLVFMAGIFINPWIQLAAALTLVTSNIYGIFLKERRTTEEFLEQNNELNKKETEERIQEIEKIQKENLDEETREVMEALFNKDDETVKDKIVEPEPHTEPRFSDLFKSKKA